MAYPTNLSTPNLQASTEGMSIFLYCPPNITLSMVWDESHFSDCFLDTLTSSVLGIYMALFGTFELLMYFRFGTLVDTRLKKYPFNYTFHLGTMVALVLLPILKVVLHSLVFSHYFYGHQLLYLLANVYVWVLSIMLVRLERNFDLPTPPVRGHSLLLIIFWCLALVMDILQVVDFSKKSWSMTFSHLGTILEFVVFIIHILSCLLCLLVGLKAPGLASVEQRYLIAYNRLMSSFKRGASFRASSLSARHPTYGSTTSNDQLLEISMDESLAISMKNLQQSTANKECIHEFSRIPRQKNGLKISVATQEENLSKNRYLNTLPYDATRVVLQDAPLGSTYINASRVTMFIDSSDNAKHYIATQGPLQSTAADFWEMVYENACPTIVMLTEVTEHSTPKCFKYWPNQNECTEFNRLLVSCVREADYSNRYFSRRPFAVREFSVINLDSQQELCVTQFQFLGWPDHGVPKRCSSFTDFLVETRQEETQGMGPIVVHCSAGVGRSGVFIMVDLAISLMECNESVQPLKLVALLRDQRPGMVQSEEQFAFACSCILKLWERLQKSSTRSLSNSRFGR